MSTEARQIRRLQEQLAEAHAELVAKDKVIDKMESQKAILERQSSVEVKKAHWQRDNAEAMVRQERFFRYCAQQGLANYMREHGLGDRIGYEPYQDPAARRVLKTSLLRELAQEVIGAPDQNAVIEKLRPDIAQILAARAVG